jgi:GNAT superfamily N-acetyltransferase
MKGPDPRQPVIRPASLSDLEVLVQFSAAMAIETEGRRLDLVRLRRGTLAVLESTRHGFYVVAEQAISGAREVVGQLLITYEWSDWRNADFWWIQSVYVHPDHRRQGVYKRMHRYIVEMARGRNDVCGVRLYVERDNRVAHTVYARVRLSRSKYDVFEEDFVLPTTGHRASSQGGGTTCDAPSMKGDGE